jgi:hypothetical protein
MAELVHEHSAHVRTREGLAYAVRVMAEPERTGMWIGWLEFHPLDRGAPTLRTDRETSQASREAVVTWALGLERAYFEGAFARAHLR